MFYLIFLVPIISCLVLFLFFRSRTTWQEYLVVALPSIFIAFILRFCIVSSQISDVEYLGSYIVRAEYYEAWDEYISQTCTRSYACGTDSDGNTQYCEETYDCSYVDYHSEYWEITHNTGNKECVSKKEYDKIIKLWNKPNVFVDMHRDYHYNDGDKYVTVYGGEKEKMYTSTTQHTYENRVMGSRSIFNFSKIEKEEADSVGLYDYPKVNRDQSPIVGLKVTKKTMDSFKFINAYYGNPYQFRTYVLFYFDKPMYIAKQQQDYLVGGNKNELVICIGLNSDTTISWVDAFSWEDVPNMEVAVEHLFDEGDKLNLNELSKLLLTEVPTKWHRKEFKDFEYLQVELDPKYIWIIWLVTIIVSTILSCAVIFNEYTNEEKNGRYY